MLSHDGMLETIWERASVMTEEAVYQQTTAAS
jgi:hypothetical protein